MLTRSLLFVAAVIASLATQANAQDKSIVVASTRPTQDSGLFGYLLPIFKAKTGIDVVVAQATDPDKALDTARHGDADVVFVHCKAGEEKFLSEGFGVKRYPVMYNDFVLIGPESDPAGVKGKDIVTALQTIKAKLAPFISRGEPPSNQICFYLGHQSNAVDLPHFEANSKHCYTFKPELRIMRSELTDHEWAAIKPMLPNKPRGVPRVNDRRPPHAGEGANRAR